MTCQLPLDVSHLDVTLGASKILHDINLSVTGGETVALLGANGSGKSTLVRAALGIVPATAGTIRLYGQDIRLKDGRLVNAEGSLAGAHVTMAEGLRRLITVVGTSPETALDMAVVAPARLLNRPDLATPEHRDTADLLLLDTDWRVTAALAEALTQLPA